LSLEVDAQKTIDETMTCSASTLEEGVNMVKTVSSIQQQHAHGMKNEIKDVKTLLVSGTVKTNETCGLGDTVKHEIKNETELLSNDIKDAKALLAVMDGTVKNEIKAVKTQLTSGSVKTNETRLEDAVKIRDEIRLLATNPIKIELDAGEPSKQALVSALVCEYLFWF